jgi:prevent-host-death family protein
MKFLSTRELRNRPGLVRRQVQKEDLVLTANGKPIAILVGVEEGELDDTVRAIQQARGQRALSRMRRSAVRGGLDRLSSTAIEGEIRTVRSRRKSA